MCIRDRIYTERDLLAAECLRAGVWNTLDAPGLAAAVSMLVHEPRRDDADPSPRMPNTAVAEAVEATMAIWSGLTEAEQHHHLPVTSAPDAGLAWMIHAWATGRRLELVLRGSDLAAGDFVRRCKQLIDLLGQLGEVAPHPAFRRKARQAADAVLRGLAAFRPVAGRSRALEIVWQGRAATLVDDSYNANPDSVLAAIDVLAELPGPRWLHSASWWSSVRGTT